MASWNAVHCWSLKAIMRWRPNVGNDVSKNSNASKATGVTPTAGSISRPHGNAPLEVPQRLPVSVAGTTLRSANPPHRPKRRLVRQIHAARRAEGHCEQGVSTYSNERSVGLTAAHSASARRQSRLALEDRTYECSTGGSIWEGPRQKLHGDNGPPNPQVPMAAKQLTAVARDGDTVTGSRVDSGVADNRGGRGSNVGDDDSRGQS